MPTLSVLLPTRHFVSQDGCLQMLDRAFADESLSSSIKLPVEVITSPVSVVSEAWRQRRPTSSTTYTSLDVVRLPPALDAHPQGWILARSERGRSCATAGCRQGLFEQAWRRLPSADVHEDVDALAAALNRAAATASGELLLLLDGLAEPMPGFVAPLIQALATPTRVGIAGGRLVDGRGLIRHAGFGVAIGRLPLHGRSAWSTPSWSSWGYGGEQAYSPSASSADALLDEVGIPVERWRGLRREGMGSRGASLGSGEAVRGVGLGLMLLKASVWHSLQGLNTSFPPRYAALDLCLRAREELGLSSVYVNRSEVRVIDAVWPKNEGRCSDGWQCSSSTTSGLSECGSENCAYAWHHQWGPRLADEIRSRWLLKRPVIWNMECGNGPTRGFTDEAITIATGLEGLVDLRLEISEPWRCEEDAPPFRPATRARAGARAQLPEPKPSCLSPSPAARARARAQMRGRGALIIACCDARGDPSHAAAVRRA